MSAPSAAPQKARAVVPTPTLMLDLGPAENRMVRLDSDEVTVGRSQNVNCRLEDPRVSRLHAELRREADAVVLVDLGSTSGTYVNGDRLEGPRVLSHGDKVAFGPVEATFESPTPTEDATAVFQMAEIEPEPDLPHLSPRQHEVVELMAEGMTNKEIGAELGVTERTVKSYAQDVYDKLGVRNRAGAVAEAVRSGLL